MFATPSTTAHICPSPRQSSEPNRGEGMVSDILLPAVRTADQLCLRHSSIDSLLVRVGEGDREAFAQLYDELSPTVYAMSVHEGQKPAVSAQVTQYVFVRAWRQAPTYDPREGPAWAWICAIAAAATEGREGYVF